MKLDSVRDFKAQILSEVIAQAGDDHEIRARYEATQPVPVAMGVAKLPGADDFVVAIRTDDPALAQEIADKAHGEADVRIIKVAKRNTPAYYQARMERLEGGAQIGMANKNFVGTLGCFVRDAAGRLNFLSNSHVIADEGRVSPGWVIGQPFGTRPIGVMTKHIPMSAVTPNLVDAAIGRLDRSGISAKFKFNGCIAGDIKGSRAITAADLGKRVLKAGRTTGAREGRITAVEVDGLPVAYDQGVLRFNDQVEITGGPSTNFSAGGDSGSLIIDENGWGIALLFAGGTDNTGEDVTYANRLTNVLEALGVQLA